MNPYSYFININEETGKKKGLKTGDWIWVESSNAEADQGPSFADKGYPSGDVIGCGYRRTLVETYAYCQG